MSPNLSFLPGSSAPLQSSQLQWLEVVGLAIVYFLLARIGQYLAIPPGNVTPVWLPSGVIFFALLWRGYYLWPGVFLGAFIGNVWAYIDLSSAEVTLRALMSGMFNGIGDCFCALVGAIAVRRELKKRTGYLSTRLVIAFLGAAVFLGPLLSAVFGVGGLWVASFIETSMALTTLITWFTGDAVGVLIIGSLLFAWWIPGDTLLVITKPSRLEYISFSLLLIFMLVLALSMIFQDLTFETGLPLMSLLPLMGWSVLRLGKRWSFSVAALIASTSIIVFVYISDVADLMPEMGNSQLLVMQSFVTVLMITTMLISAITYQWADTYLVMKRERNRAEEASRFKSNFLASISHELRTPMNGVIGFIDLLRGTDLSGVQASYVRGVEQSSRHMMTLIEELLDLAKAESGEIDIVLERYSPKDLVEGVINLFRPQSDNAGLDLSSDIATDVPACLYGDEQRIRQVLMNFVSNAIKFTTQGEVWVQIYKVSGDKVRFSVRDSGIGIAESDQQVIFQPFAQAAHNEEHHGGTGLGLHICKRLIESMGGEIGVESSSERGSIFWFDLPLHIGDEDSELDTLSQQSKPIFAALNLHVLVADDNTVNMTVVTTMLKKLGCGFVCAENGQQVIDLAKQEKFDAILLDCMMPEVDGYQAAENLTRQPNINSNTPIIAFTANAIDDNRERCLRSGMVDFLSKPITMHSLNEVLVRTVIKNQGANQ
jgi:signal transduction histidine kinase/CheY-like chemotaxis protein